MQLKIQCPVCKTRDLIDRTMPVDCPNCKLSLKLDHTFIWLLNHIEKCNEEHDSECYGKAVYKLSYDKKTLILTCMCSYYIEIADVVNICINYARDL